MTDLQSADYKNPQLPVEQRMTDLLRHMTLEEKIKQMQYGRHDAEFELDEHGEILEQTRKFLKSGIGGLGRPGLALAPRETARLTNAIQKYLIEQTRLGIPALFHNEALHGLMNYGSTSFPQAIALASTWDPHLVQAAFAAVAAETRARGGNHVLTPVLDLAREPRWGRTDETYGEDPYLIARMGVACIRGLQGPEPQPDREHVLVTAKHFAAHGQPEAGSNCGPGNYAERELREQFLPPFEAAVKEAGVHSLMVSYNEINGIPAHVNGWLLRQVLRQEWGFRGLIVSDGGGIEMLYLIHRVVETIAEAGRKALESGIEFELPIHHNGYETLAQQVRAGLVSETLIDRATAQILRVKFQLGLFDLPYADPETAERVNNCPAHRQLALQAAHKALVLLKNDGGLLPLDKNKIKSMAVIGPNAAALHLGSYSYDPGNGVSILQGIQNKVGGQIKVTYAEGCRITQTDLGWRGWWEDEAVLSDPAEDARRIAEAVQVARAADVAFVVVGENESTCREGWSAEHMGDRDSLELLGSQNDLVKAIVETGVPTIVLLINGRPLSINYIAKHVPAILEGWYLGQAGGTAVADVLFGDVTPGGKLPITFPQSVGQLPVFYNHKPSARRGYLFTQPAPLFPFGHGLSYTTFKYEHLQVTPQKIGPAGTAVVRVNITNTGARAGDEVVQLYIRDCVSTVTRPVKELKGFQRITLQPGEMRPVEFLLTPAELSFFNEHMERVVEPGRFDIMVGTSSAQFDTVMLEVEAA